LFGNAEALRSVHGFTARRPYLMVWGQSRDIDSKKKKRVNSLKNIFHYSDKIVSYSVDDRVVDEFALKIENHIQVYGYACAINDICVRLNQRNFRESKEVIFCLTSERVEHSFIKNIKRVFSNAKVVVEYGAIEYGVLGISSPSSNVETDIDLLSTMYNINIDKGNNLFLRDAIIGGIFFDRYYTDDKVGDVICSKASLFTVDNIAGRWADVVKVKGLDGKVYAFHTILLYHAMWKLTAYEFSIKITDTKLYVQTVDSALLDRESHFRSIVKEYVGGALETEIILVNEVERKRSSSGKQKSIWFEKV
jgi:hypothetical protein